MRDYPLVSVGIPVRNGAATLTRALDSILKQTHDNLEIIISDNCSTDGTGDICAAYAQRDKRIRHISTGQPLSPLANFRTTFDQARGEYFMWAAHDDWRAEGYVATLLDGFRKYPSAVLVFSDLVVEEDLLFDPHQAVTKGRRYEWDFTTAGLTFVRRLRKQIQIPPIHIYGLIRAAALRKYTWHDIDYAPDLPLMLALSTHGDFIYVPGTVFVYHWIPAVIRSMRMFGNSDPLQQFRRWPRLRCAWACATVVKDAERKNGRSRLILPLFLRLYFWQYRSAKAMLYELAPRAVRRAWASEFNVFRKSS